MNTFSNLWTHPVSVWAGWTAVAVLWQSTAAALLFAIGGRSVGAITSSRSIVSHSRRLLYARWPPLRLRLHWCGGRHSRLSRHQPSLAPSRQRFRRYRRSRRSLRLGPPCGTSLRASQAPCGLLEPH